MSRELDRRIAALERVKHERGIEYVVLDYAHQDDEREPFKLRLPMTESAWVAVYCSNDG